MQCMTCTPAALHAVQFQSMAGSRTRLGWGHAGFFGAAVPPPRRPSRRTFSSGDRRRRAPAFAEPRWIDRRDADPARRALRILLLIIRPARRGNSDLRRVLLGDEWCHCVPFVCGGSRRRAAATRAAGGRRRRPPGFAAGAHMQSGAVGGRAVGRPRAHVGRTNLRCGGCFAILPPRFNSAGCNA
jgi:hypothetical protein